MLIWFLAYSFYILYFSCKTLFIPSFSRRISSLSRYSYSSSISRTIITGKFKFRNVFLILVFCSYSITNTKSAQIRSFSESFRSLFSLSPADLIFIRESFLKRYSAVRLRLLLRPQITSMFGFVFKILWTTILSHYLPGLHREYTHCPVLFY